MLDDEFYVAPPAQVSLDSHEIAYLVVKNVPVKSYLTWVRWNTFMLCKYYKTHSHF